MLERLSPTVRNLLLAGLGVGLCAFAWSVRSVLNPLIAAYFLAYAIHPMVIALQRRRGFSRAAAVNTIFGLFFFAVLITLVGLGLQANRLVRSLPDLAENVEGSLDAWIAEHPAAVSWVLELVDEEVEEQDAEAGAPPPAAEPESGTSNWTECGVRLHR